jgi:hypothetical protein
MLALIVVFSLTVSANLALPFEDHQPAILLTEAENCLGACLMGIRPGTTTLGQAMASLQNHDWVDSVQLSASGAGYGQIRWIWSGRQPDVIDASRLGRITFFWDQGESGERELTDTVIETVSMYTRVKMPSLQSWFGSPDAGAANFYHDGGLAYTIAYHIPGGTLSLWSGIPCPVNLMSYWNAPTRITMSIGRSNSKYIEPSEMVKIC